MLGCFGLLHIAVLPITSIALTLPMDASSRSVKLRAAIPNAIERMPQSTLMGNVNVKEATTLPASLSVTAWDQVRIRSSFLNNVAATPPRPSQLLGAGMLPTAHACRQQLKNMFRSS